MSTSRIIVSFLIVYITYCSCIMPMSTKKINIEKDILLNEINYTFPDHQRPETIYLKLNNEVNCDLQLGLFDIYADSIILKNSFRPSELSEGKYIVDWYSKSIIVRALKPLQVECTTLDIDLSISYWNY